MVVLVYAVVVVGVDVTTVKEVDVVSVVTVAKDVVVVVDQEFNQQVKLTNFIKTGACIPSPHLLCLSCYIYIAIFRQASAHC